MARPSAEPVVDLPVHYWWHNFGHPSGACALVWHKATGLCCGDIRKSDPVSAADPCDILVLLSCSAGYRASHRQLLLGPHCLCSFRGSLLFRNHAGGHPKRQTGSGSCWTVHRSELLADTALCRIATGVPEHDPDPRHTRHHPVSRYVTGLCCVAARFHDRLVDCRTHRRAAC